MKTLALLILLGLMLPIAVAHQLYAEFPQSLDSETSAEFWIAYGHGGSADTKIDSLPVAQLISPVGSTKDIEVVPFQDGLKGSVSLEEPGCYLLDLQMMTTFFDPASFGSSGSKSLVEKFGRVLLPYQSGEGYQWSSGTGLEIVPQTDPYQLKSGEEFRVRALWNGKPVPGSYSAVINRHPDDILVVQHVQDTEFTGESDDGSINFETGQPGLWVLSYEATIDESGSWTAVADDPSGNYKKGDKLIYDEIAPTASLTFWVSE